MAIIGIDLGTSNSAAALLRDGRPLLIPRAGRARADVKAFPSFVAITADGTTLVGEAARRQRLRNPEGTATGFKRGMGRPTPVRLRGRALAPEQLSGLLLAGIRREAEAFLGASVQGAVVSVPTHFDDDRRRATQEACRLAGFSAAAIVDEPTAAAVARGLDREDRRRRVLVVDFGAGSLDVTVGESGPGTFEVLASAGGLQTAGLAIDAFLVDRLAERFERETGVDVRADRLALERLRAAVEVARVELSKVDRTRLSLPALVVRRGEPRHLIADIGRRELERALEPQIAQCDAVIFRALRDAQVAVREVDRLLLFGGLTRMPLVRNHLETLLGHRAEDGHDPLNSVALGAALMGESLALRDLRRPMPLAPEPPLPARPARLPGRTRLRERVQRLLRPGTSPFERPSQAPAQ